MYTPQDLAERIRKFYYYRALLCERLLENAVNVSCNSLDMPPLDFDPSHNLYVDAYIIGCAAIDGLASIWESLNQVQANHNRERFTVFMIETGAYKYLNRISTPFLVFFLRKQGIEEVLVREVEARWLKNREANESHRIYNDPTTDELKAIYEACQKMDMRPTTASLKNPDVAFLNFTYASLIYKFYRCSFIHQFRTSRFATTLFNKGNEISIRQNLAKSLIPHISNGLDEFEYQPQLDVGIGVITDSIRKGVDKVYSLILEQKCVNIPYGSNDEITLKVK